MLVATGVRDGRAAEASRDAGSSRSRQLEPQIMHRIFPCRKIPMPAPGFEIGFGKLGQESLPTGFEVASRPLEVRRRTLVAADDKIGCRIKAARPAPPVNVVWNPSTNADAADANVAIVDAPGFLMGVVAEAAGEGGHAL